MKLMNWSLPLRKYFNAGLAMATKSICGNLVAAGEDPGHNLPAGPALHVVLPHRRRHPQTQVLLYRHILQLQPRAGLHLHLGVTVNPKVTLGRLLVQPLSGLPAFASLVHWLKVGEQWTWDGEREVGAWAVEWGGRIVEAGREAAAVGGGGEDDEEPDLHRNTFFFFSFWVKASQASRCGAHSCKQRETESRHSLSDYLKCTTVTLSDSLSLSDCPAATPFSRPMWGPGLY